MVNDDTIQLAPSLNCQIYSLLRGVLRYYISCHILNAVCVLLLEGLKRSCRAGDGDDIAGLGRCKEI